MCKICTSVPKPVNNLLVVRISGCIKPDWSNLGQKYAQLTMLKDGKRLQVEKRAGGGCVCLYVNVYY